MRRTAVCRLVSMALVFFLAACVQLPSPTADDAKALIAKARWTVQTFKQSPGDNMKTFRRMLKDAAGVAIFPGIVKAGFVFAAEGGSGVIMARDPKTGKWGQPGFYFLGAASFGLLIGGQVAEVVLILRSPGALEALIDHQGKLGADMEITTGPIGAGIEGSITTNLGADIVAFSQAAGLYGGISVEGAVLAKRRDMNTALYGAGATPRGIILEGKFTHPAADSLRAALASP